MAKIDLEKVLIALLDSPFNKQFDDKVKDALKEQGLEYKDGEIVEIQKSKFKVGDWVVLKDGGYFSTGSKTVRIKDIIGREIWFETGTWASEDEVRHWTIEDAKNGDVLVDVYGNIGIFEKHDDFNWTSYCSLGVRGGFQSFKVEHENEKTYPATKEQRDLLFQKMKEAGYEWDTEKKELKKIRKPLYEAGNIIGYKSHYYYIKKVVKNEEKGFHYNLIAVDGGEVISIGPAGEKDIILISNNRFDYEHANIQQKDFAPKASTANRQLYNRAILKILSNYVEKYPDIRFGQMLCNLDVNPHFDEESRETYWNLSKTINKQNHE